MVSLSWNFLQRDTSIHVCAKRKCLGEQDRASLWSTRALNLLPDGRFPSLRSQADGGVAGQDNGVAPQRLKSPEGSLRRRLLPRPPLTKFGLLSGGRWMMDEATYRRESRGATPAPYASVCANRRSTSTVVFVAGRGIFPITTFTLLTALGCYPGVRRSEGGRRRAVSSPERHSELSGIEPNLNGHLGH